MTMDEKIARINALAHKAKGGGLADEEGGERAGLRGGWVGWVGGGVE